jgi:hypothetical protein
MKTRWKLGVAYQIADSLPLIFTDYVVAKTYNEARELFLTKVGDNLNDVVMVLETASLKD